MQSFSRAAVILTVQELWRKNRDSYFYGAILSDGHSTTRMDDDGFQGKAWNQGKPWNTMKLDARSLVCGMVPWRM